MCVRPRIFPRSASRLWNAERGQLRVCLNTADATWRARPATSPLLPARPSATWHYRVNGSSEMKVNTHDRVDTTCAWSSTSTETVCPVARARCVAAAIFENGCQRKVDVRLRCKAPRKVDVRLPGKGNANSHGARPVHLIITMIKWFRTSRLSIKNSLSSKSSPSAEERMAEGQTTGPRGTQRDSQR